VPPVSGVPTYRRRPRAAQYLGTKLHTESRPTQLQPPLFPNPAASPPHLRYSAPSYNKRLLLSLVYTTEEEFVLKRNYTLNATLRAWVGVRSGEGGQEHLPIDEGWWSTDGCSTEAQAITAVDRILGWWEGPR